MDLAPGTGWAAGRQVKVNRIRRPFAAEAVWGDKSRCHLDTTKRFALVHPVHQLLRESGRPGRGRPFGCCLN